MIEIFDPTECALGEGPLWHPERQSLFWFDIIGMQLFERGLDDGEATSWKFDEHISAAGWVDENTLLIASETALSTFDLTEGESQFVVDLEIGNETTRSNDGRADPLGGFWIGTMGKNAEAGAGAIYRYFDGELRKLFSKITISNSICFSPDGTLAYFCDTSTKIIQKVSLDGDGWPNDKLETFVELSAEGLNPDGSVVDADGNLWNAQWGASRVACYSPIGEFIRAVEVPTPHASCPAFGGPDLKTLYITTAREGLAESQLENAGHVFAIELDVKGQQENRINL